MIKKITFRFWIVVLLLTIGNIVQAVAQDKEKLTPDKIQVLLDGEKVDLETGFSASEKGILSVAVISEQISLEKVYLYLVRGTRPIVYKTFTNPAEFKSINLNEVLESKYGVAVGDRVVLEFISTQGSTAVNIPLHE